MLARVESECGEYRAVRVRFVLWPSHPSEHADEVLSAGAVPPFMGGMLTPSEIQGYGDLSISGP
jgi:hypothetical protein